MTTMRPGGVNDRFGTPLDATRRGAHRARPTAVLVLLPSIAVVVVIAAVALLTWSLFGRGLPTSQSESDPAANPVAGAPADPSATQPAATAPATDPPSPAPTDGATEPAPTDGATEPAAEVDRTLTIDVLNGTTTSGLARSAAAALEGTDWIVGEVANFDGTVEGTTVFFARKAQRPTAEALAEEVGGTAVRDEDVAAERVTVVLGDDYTP